MDSRIITISREIGSGGHTIGRLAAERLGIPCYDQELIEKVAQESGLSQEYILEKGEDTPRTGLLTGTLFYDRSYSGFSVQDMLWEAQKKVILDLAGKGPSVIVGRCGDYILQGKADLLRVFVFAAPELRAQRLRETYGESEKNAIRRVEEKDKRRRAFYRLYTDIEWGETRNYDLTLNSGTLGIEECVNILCGAYRKE